MKFDYETIHDKCTYIHYANEVCPDTNREHHQGYVGFTKRTTLRGAKRILPGCHLEPRMGTLKQNEDYCSKYGELIKWGTVPKCDGINKLSVTEYIERVKAKATTIELIEEFPGLYLRQPRGLQLIRNAFIKTQRTAPRLDLKVYFLTGPTGCGKTRMAMGHEPYKIMASEMQWWDHYDGETDLLIDEYDNDVRITSLTALLDVYVKRLPVKGSFTYANWLKVYLTANLKFLHLKAKQEHQDALNRRISSGGILSWWNRVENEASFKSHYPDIDIVWLDSENNRVEALPAPPLQRKRKSYNVRNTHDARCDCLQCITK